MTAHLPLDFPGLQEEARRLARELIDADDPDLPRPSRVPEHHVRAHARLLADLARPESQSFWLRALAARCGVPIPAVGAPSWKYEPTRAMWVIGVGSGEMVHCFGGYDAGFGNWTGHPDLIGMADPIVALHLTLHVVFGVTP